ncbi:hypothetical protein R1flu_028519 [Riccia fluitans]|uniref:Secreted protein n=1 Tax=Riccia fluitans TaxID=41844 RepID=A0ABD1XPS0_9MARC
MMFVHGVSWRAFAVIKRIGIFGIHVIFGQVTLLILSSASALTASAPHVFRFGSQFRDASGFALMVPRFNGPVLRTSVHSGSSIARMCRVSGLYVGSKYCGVDAYRSHYVVVLSPQTCTTGPLCQLSMPFVG